MTQAGNIISTIDPDQHNKLIAFVILSLQLHDQGIKHGFLAGSLIWQRRWPLINDRDLWRIGPDAIFWRLLYF